MPLTMFPIPGADLWNAGYELRDRGRYLQYGTFRWFPSGSHAFTGVLIGYAPGAGLSATQTIDNVSGSIGVDGGTAYPCYGFGAIEIGRWCASSVQVNGGIAWGVDFPLGSNLPSSNEVRHAVDRAHKDRSYLPYSYVVQHGEFPTNNHLLQYTAPLINQAGAGVLKALSCQIDYVPPGTTFNAQLALDVYLDGVYYFSVGITRRTLAGDGQMPGMTASVGYIPYTSNLTVSIRRAHSGTQLQVWASVLFSG